MLSKINNLNERQEIKFIFNLRNFFNFRLKKRIKKVFPTRIVNSIYFDTYNFDFFHKSEEVLSFRKKIRVRYYNSYNEIPALEIKFTNNYSRSKYVKKFLIKDYNQKFIKNECEDISIIPKVKISYLRDYYQSEIGRITVDKKIMCKNIFSYENSLSVDIIPNTKIFNNSNVVVELKTDNSFSKYEAIKYFEQNDTRMSKYCEAIKKLYSK